MTENGKRSTFCRELKGLNWVTPNIMSLPTSNRRKSYRDSDFEDSGTVCNLNSQFDSQTDDKENEEITANTEEEEDPSCRHIIVYLPHLYRFICHNFLCRRCHKRVSREDLSHLLVGVAGAVNWICGSCKTEDQISPLKTATKNSEDLANNYSSDKMHYQRKQNFAKSNSAVSNYSLNWRFNLLLQQIGGGILEANSICSMLDLRPSVHQSFRDIEQKIGMVQIDYGKKIIHANMLEEMEASPNVDVSKFLEADATADAQKQRRSLSIQLDTGWSNRGSGRSYNSDSGHSVMFGNKTKKVVSCFPMSKRCAKCEKNIPHEQDFCSKNYDGSSKGMEAYAGEYHTTNIWNNYNAFIGECVMDDDSSTRAIMRHSHRRRLELGTMLSLPLTAKGNVSKDNGKLPYAHPPIKELCDHNHRCRGYCKLLFKLGRGKLKDSLLTVSDAERIKANFGYWLRQNLQKPFEEFQRTAICIIDHHFNCHDHCDKKWCKYLQCETDEERVELCKTYRDKSKNSKMYRQVRDNHDTFMTEEALRQLYHPFHTNHCEGFMWNVATLCPKSKHYCRTINYGARCFVAVGTNSLGYEQYYNKLFDLLDLESGFIITDSLDRKDRGVKRKRDYRRQPAVQKQMAAKRIQKLIKGRLEVIKSNSKGHVYESNISGPSGELGKQDVTSGAKQKTDASKRICPYCGIKGHVTTRSKYCLKHVPAANKNS